MSAGTGSAVIDFDAYPGQNEASVTVSGVTAIVSTDHAEAWFMADATADHTPSDHRYAAALASLTCSPPVDGVGFTITATSIHKMQGTFKVHYVWAS